MEKIKALMDSNSLEDELRCSVCLDIYTEPQLLPCGHNFCLQCLMKLKRHSKHNYIHCPECRESHYCLDQWQKNIKLASIVEEFQRYRQGRRFTQPLNGTGEVCCDYCGLGITEDSAGTLSTAVMTCLKCEVSMCPEHVQPHLKLPAFRKHPLVEPINDLMQRKCAEHDEIFRYYCMEEHKLLCNVCVIWGGHSQHTIKTLETTMKELQGSLNTQLRNVSRKIKKTDIIVQRQEKMQQQNKTFLEELDQQVDALRGFFMTKLDRFVSMLSGCVRSYGEKNSLIIQHKMMQNGLDQGRLRLIQTEINWLLSKTDPFECIKGYLSFAKSHRMRLKKPLFQPQAVRMDEKEIETEIEEKMQHFMLDLMDHIAMFIDTVCAVMNERGEKGLEKMADEETEEVETEDLEETDEEVNRNEYETNNSNGVEVREEDTSDDDEEVSNYFESSCDSF